MPRVHCNDSLQRTAPRNTGMDAAHGTFEIDVDHVATKLMRALRHLPVPSTLTDPPKTCHAPELPAQRMSIPESDNHHPRSSIPGPTHRV